MGTRRQFSREFKLEAVRLVRERGVSVAQASRDLDVHENVLRKWMRDVRADPLQAVLVRGAGSGAVPRRNSGAAEPASRSRETASAPAS